MRFTAGIDLGGTNIAVGLLNSRGQLVVSAKRLTLAKKGMKVVSVRMADALIRANKRFDFFVFPGQRHGYGDMSDYWFWLRAEYFADHLLGNGRWSADITELQVESPKTR